jgi:hypothetical protein
MVNGCRLAGSLNADADNTTKQKCRTATIVPECVFQPAKAHSKLNQPFFNIIAPGHSAAAINNSPIQQFTH